MSSCDCLPIVFMMASAIGTSQGGEPQAAWRRERGRDDALLACQIMPAGTASAAYCVRSSLSPKSDACGPWKSGSLPSSAGEVQGSDPRCMRIDKPRLTVFDADAVVAEPGRRSLEVHRAFDTLRDTAEAFSCWRGRGNMGDAAHQLVRLVLELEEAQGSVVAKVVDERNARELV